MTRGNGGCCGAVRCIGSISAEFQAKRPATDGNHKIVTSRSNRNVIMAWTLLAVAVTGFCAVAWLVTAGITDDLDKTVLLSLRDAGDPSELRGPVWLEEAAVELTALGGYPILAVISAAVLGVLLLARQAAAAWFLLLALSSGSLFSTALKQFFARPRPDLVDHFDRVFTSSFPSAHAMVSMLAWLTLAGIAIRFVRMHRLRMFILVLAFAVALMVGVSRVYLGVHWPSDVLAGWLIGLAWSSGCWLVASYMSRSTNQTADLGHSET